MTTLEEFHAEADRLTAELAAASDAWMEVKNDPDNEDRPMRKLRLEAAQHALVHFRSYWRSIGNALDDESHPGWRPDDMSTVGIRTLDNTEG